ncbi:flap endonuclease-1 [Candidatus Woesearchaeota archaeon B3_Woes]|nr:MAG: flap endonuclease-1 [Candidatus Woesearchaeota archaeon B3_Woes]
MGIAFKDIILGKEIDIKTLKGKTLIIDTFNLLYQFLSSIRSRDGSLLTDSQGNVTSHLIGLFSRITNLLQYDLKLVFVFDGEPPSLKQKERERRKQSKIQAQKKYETAKAKEDIESMKKYASRTTALSQEMIEDAKKLIQYLGLPIVQAPSEGEAQAVYIAKKENCFVVSQDYDSLLYGIPQLIRNLSILGKRKQTNKLSYTTVKPEIIDLADVLNNLTIDLDQLIAMAMLIGTDYNPGGIKGIGPKNALTLVKKYKKDFDSLFKEVKWNEFFDFEWKEVYDLFKKMPVTDDYELKWKSINTKEIKEFLLKHDFSEERINSTLEKLEKKENSKKQKSLFEF